MIYSLITFRSRNDALAMRSYLSSRGVTSATVNAPRSLTQSCGLALKIQSVSSSTRRIDKILPVQGQVLVISSIYGTGRYKVQSDNLESL